jgi:flagellar basal-body rod protein FlgC
MSTLGSAVRAGASALAAERMRIEVAVSNLANAESTRGPDGRPYARLDPVMRAVDFETALGAPGAPGDGGLQVVEVAEIARDETPGRRVYSPSHPDADPDGFVVLPNVNPIHEVVNLMSAQKSYDANATAVDTLKTMAQRALDIAR